MSVKLLSAIGKPGIEGAAQLSALLSGIEPLGKRVFHVGDGLAGLIRHILAEALHLGENAHMRRTELTATGHDASLFSRV